MPKIISSPSVIKAAGNKPKIIEEFIGRVNSHTTEVSMARMKSPPGWMEPGQQPEFREYSIVIKGMLRVKTEKEEFDVYAGKAAIVEKGEWVQYSTPGSDGAEYMAVCLPAFSPETANRDE